ARLTLASGFMQFVFLIDDQYDTDTVRAKDIDWIHALFQRSLAVLSGNAAPQLTDPFERFTNDLRRGLIEASTPEWMAAFLAHVHDELMLGALPLLTYQAHGDVLSPDEYLYLRELDMGAYPCIDCIEIAGGFTLPPDVREHPLLRKLARHVVRHVICVNDLCSYENEVLRHGLTNNLVFTIQHERRASFETAMEAVVRLANSEAEAFLATQRDLSSAFARHLTKDITAYATGMARFMRGNYDFAISSPRYRESTE
ncbi:MAG TPA: hypothetical protein VG963_19790, partial [Polyangiaceae bacterium]|nr:hypothetical protein [Polyangiaceae bacterium]